MGRNLLITKQEFIKAHKRAKSMKELADLLHIAVPTIYTYMTRYKVKLYPRNEKLDPVKVGANYQFNVTIQDIATKLNVSWATIQHCLQKLVLYPDRYTLTPKKKNYLPPPHTVREIRIINLIRKHPKYIDCPWPMVELPGISEKLVDGYYRHAFGYELKRYKKGEE